MADETLPLPFPSRPQRSIATKRCAICSEIKPLTEFYDRTDRSNRKQACCKKCTVAETRRRRRQHPEVDAAYRRDNPEKIKKWRRSTYENGRKDFRRCITMMLSVRSRQCAKKGIPFEISFDDVNALFNEQNGLCSLTGRALIWGASGRPRDGLSVDRLNGSLGYIQGNIRLVTDQANLARNRFSDEELFAFCEAVLATRSG